MNFQDPQIAALLQALQGSASQDQRENLLAQQQQQAQQMAEGAQGRPAYGLAGGIGQGLASAFSGIRGAKIANQQEAALGKRDDYMSALVKALQGGQGGGMLPSGAAPMDASPGGWGLD